MADSPNSVHVIGGGLAGSEAAWQLARAGVPTVLHEMRPHRATDAHLTGGLAELVCSNSFRSDDAETSAIGLLHEEMRRAGSLILGAGDELMLRFSAADEPLPPGWRRDFLLFVDGWAKEHEANTAFGDSVEPLPFHKMTGYPYGPDEHYPDGPLHREYLEKYVNRPALRLIRPLHEP